ncbi:hypothetical protein SAMN04488005_2913 [Yoonia tamlensis]|uniref:Uncharacterized protein n=1 Tax=Yoonia tamlensis TaxID=390270 RepID=A0A1I6HPB6_9RHOB|nr:hypothetical protein [Yoonia tamlensis]SFR56295.1 hypothetical protein SAMN04488005_2913 [Yoonia tamlensis]
MFSLAPPIATSSDREWCWFLRGFGKSGDVIERALYAIGVMDHSGWATWQHSSLTATGAPVVVRFATCERALSIITEVANPAHDPATKLATACNIITALGGIAPDQAFREVISAAQGASALTWGACLGLRHDGKQLQFTLYAELPAEAHDLSALLSQIDPGACQGAYMLAYDTRGRRITYYCKPDSTTPLPAVLGGAQPVSTRNEMGAPHNRAFAIDPATVLSGQSRLARQVNSFKQIVFRRHPCLVDHQLTEFPETAVVGNIWVTGNGPDNKVVSFDLAAPWIGADHPVALVV